jgi:hypothetical protein
MTDSQTPLNTDALAPVPGLHLLGTDSQAGMCVDGYCVLPGQSLPATPAQKAATQD